MEWHRKFIDNIVNLLPTADVLLRRLRSERGDNIAPEEERGVTTEGLKKEYKFPDHEVWEDLWTQSQDAAERARRKKGATPPDHTAPVSDTGVEPSDPHKRHRERGAGKEEETAARPSKHSAPDQNPSRELPNPRKRRREPNDAEE
ncbi:hypothetical protein C8A03DRAFT_33017, partial [Achaetomium macrosporum]